jgi:hypothetical protein
MPFTILKMADLIAIIKLFKGNLSTENLSPGLVIS